MFSNRCSFCDHANPADSKFCGACGGALHLAPCPGCGAVTNVTAIVCYQCGAPLRAGATQTETSDAFPPAAEVPPSPMVDLFRRLAAGGDFPPTADAPTTHAAEVRSPPPATTPRAAEASSARAADIPSRLAARVAFPPAAEVPAPLPPATAAPPAAEAPGPSSLAAELGLTSAVPEISEASPRRPARVMVVAAVAVLAVLAVLGYAYRQRTPVDAAAPGASSETKAAGAIPRSLSIGKAGDRAPARPEACTEAVAALGLCPPKGIQKKEAKADPAPQAVNTRSQETGAGKAGEQKPPHTTTCTEATAALGLCTPKPTQRKE